MHVYLVRYAKLPQFKVGKANDICYRLSKLGDLSEFDLEASYCIRVPSSQIAYKIETAIQHLFDPWNIKPNKTKKRKSGDTELFKIECYERVLRFLHDNPDLVFGAVPKPIPVPVKKVGPRRRNPEQIRQDKEKREKEEQMVAALNFDLAMLMFEAVTEKLSDMGLDVFELCETPNHPKQFIYLESDDRELFDRAVLMVGELIHLSFNPILDPNVVLRASVLNGQCVRWDPSAKRGRMSVILPVPVTNENRHTLNQEYVRIHDMLPRSSILRELVDFDIFSSPDDEEDVYVPTMP